MDLPVVAVDPLPPHAHTHTVVFLHGRGDNTRSFMASLGRWRDSHGRGLADVLPSFRWVFPQAPLGRCAAGPHHYTWPQWFDVWNTDDFADREELQADGLRQSVPAVAALLAREVARLGGRWDRIVLAGISMGGATSVHTLFNLEVPETGTGTGTETGTGTGGGHLAAFLGFSCRCPFSGRTLAEMRQVLGLRDDNTDNTDNDDGVPAHSSVLCNTPILLEHCVDDPLVRVENGRALRDTLRGFGATVQWKEYPSGGHWFNAPAGMDDAVEFLNTYVVDQNSPGTA